jgi:molybdate transport system substrate-binding protein
LVLVVAADSRLQVQSFSDLEKPNVTNIAVGNPNTVPVGQYARQLLRHMQLWPKVDSRLILAENVHQVLDYVVRPEVQTAVGSPILGLVHD